MIKKVHKYSKKKYLTYSSWGPHSTRFRDRKNYITSIFSSSHMDCLVVWRSHYQRKSDPSLLLKRFYYPQRLHYRFKGKAYRLKYKDNVVFMRFHRSHPTHFYYKNVPITTMKNKGFDLLIYKTHEGWRQMRWYFNSVRKRNLFTARGLWDKKALYFKKKGKISGYR